MNPTEPSRVIADMLPCTATFQDIAQRVPLTDDRQYQFAVGERKVIAQRKFTYCGNGVVKTHYLHLWHVTAFSDGKVVTHWKEGKDGRFTPQ